MGGKLAIVTSGGGMKCSYSVGAMLALVDKFGLTDPDIIIGGSGSAGTIAYYVARQYDSIRNIWANLLPAKKFLNRLRFGKIIDIDYLVDEVFKKQDPLDAETVRTSSMRHLIPATNAETGEVEYFADWNKVDVFQALRATKAIPVPFVYGKAVKINGSAYRDTYNSSSIELNILKAIEEGATKILAIDNSQGKWSKIIYGLWLRFQSRVFRENYSHGHRQREEFKVPGDVELYVIVPEVPLRITTLNNDQGLLKETIDQGHNEVCKNRNLEYFLNK